MNNQELEKLRRELQYLAPRQKLYILLKEELTKQGHWKNKPRGKPNFNLCQRY